MESRSHYFPRPFEQLTEPEKQHTGCSFYVAKKTRIRLLLGEVKPVFADTAAIWHLLKPLLAYFTRKYVDYSA